MRLLMVLLLDIWRREILYLLLYYYYYQNKQYRYKYIAHKTELLKSRCPLLSHGVPLQYPPLYINMYSFRCAN